jgi:hypothetical protein
MKIRQGFVSNSSSSSFVIALEEMPKSPEELQKLLFGDRQEYHAPYGEGFWSTEQVANTVFEDLKRQKPLTKRGVAKEIASGYFPGYPELDYSADWKEIDWEARNKEVDDAAKQYAEGFIKSTKGMKYFVLCYGDEDGSYYSALEHGGLLKAIRHIHISHH